MMDALSLLIYPFVACVLLVLIHTYFGIHILERGIIFVDLCLAQLIGLGMAISLARGYDKEASLFSLLFAVLGALILTFSRHIARLTNIEAFIGTLYVFSLSASILILEGSPHGLEELKAILNGNILWVTPEEILHMATVYLLAGSFLIVLNRRFFELSRRDTDRLSVEFLFFLGFAIVLVSSVRLPGVLRVFAFLVIPALVGRLFTQRPSKILLTGWLTGILASLAGITVSYFKDLPASPLIVLFLCCVLFVLLLFRACCPSQKG